MIIKNLKIVTLNEVIEAGWIQIQKGIIQEIGVGQPSSGTDTIIDGAGKIAFPGFIDVHIHGSCGIDFMDAKQEDFKTIANALYKEGTTTFLATTLTSDFDSLKRVCMNVASIKDEVPSLLGIHLEGPYINKIYKGAQNEEYIRKPDIEEMKALIAASNQNVRYITIAPEMENSLPFISFCKENNIVSSAGHSNASFAEVAEAIKHGLTNTTHTHNAMSGHHHRNPGIVTAAFYFNELYTECICDGIHVCEDTLKTFYNIVGADRFVMITDALLAKHSDVQEFKLFGLDCIRKNNAAYLKSGPLAGSLLSMDQGLRNVKAYTNASYIDLAKISSTNAARCLHLEDRGEIKVGKKADLVLMDEELNVQDVYKDGIKVA